MSEYKAACEALDKVYDALHVEAAMALKQKKYYKWCDLLRLAEKVDEVRREVCRLE